MHCLKFNLLFVCTLWDIKLNKQLEEIIKLKKFKTQKFGNKHKVDIHWSHSKLKEVCAVHLKYDIGKWNNINESIAFMAVVLKYDAIENMPEVLNYEIYRFFNKTQKGISWFWLVFWHTVEVWDENSAGWEVVRDGLDVCGCGAGADKMFQLAQESSVY